MFHSLPPNKDLQPLSASDCEDDPQIPELIKEKIGYVFRNLHSNNFPGLLLQFWAPLKIAGRRLLTTSDQPFLLHDSEIYRSHCVRYKYNIDVNKVEVEEEPTNSIISRGSVATAFLNQLPELVGHQRVDGMNPLETCALECGLVCSFVLPVFYPSQSCCVGVIEYASSCYNHLQLFNLLNSVLQKVGLKTFDAQEHLPYKTVCGLQNVKDEIDEALKIIWARNRFISAQVWIACEDENHVAFTSSFEETQMKRMIGLKLTGDCFISDHAYFILQQKWLEAYGNACYNLPLKMDEGLAGKTLQNYEPHFIDNIDILSANAPQRLFSCVFKHTCLVIYLRSTKTRDLDYVFEFLWGHERQHSAFLFESLLLELMERLPSFKFASGADVGDELRILNVKNSTKSELEYFKIFTTESGTPKRERRQRLEVEECLRPLKGKCKTTPIPLSQKDIQPHFGKTMIEAAKHLDVSLSTLKRKCKVLGIPEWPKKDYSKRSIKHSYKNKNEEVDYGGAVQDPAANNGETYLDENTVTIKAVYADDMIKFHLPTSSATFGAIEKEISEGFKLSPSDYKIKYLDEDGDWILLSSDKDMRVCIQNHRNLNISAIKMQVLLW